ncbi:hypothetical protein EC9_27820 [Rosistilla ulvae]|uniref:Uncharacterized protein n=1 Tax=Rosistilla ulvae TaxID=1930277 RepID=A0A517M136_9BACT|nr:hypothetical protein EC9_27820 [Rosistilla ulvae]
MGRGMTQRWGILPQSVWADRGASLAVKARLPRGLKMVIGGLEKRGEVDSTIGIESQLQLPSKPGATSYGRCFPFASQERVNVSHD